MSERLEVQKTYKLFINGKFPRTESGRSIKLTNTDGQAAAHLCHASRKDLREATEAARIALGKWSSRASKGATAYLRAQILYRMAEMMEGKKKELIDAVGMGEDTRGGEVVAAIDRMVGFAGWADKYAQVLGCNNPVSGPYYNFTTPEPIGVVGVIAPDELPLLGLISLMAPPLCAGNTVVILASETNPIPGAIFGEVCATSDVPAGVVNILTGYRDELIPHFASHRGIDAIHAAGLCPEHRKALEEGAAENMKRVTVREIPAATDDKSTWFDQATCESPWWIEPFVEMKTVWHPSGT